MNKPIHRRLCVLLFLWMPFYASAQFQQYRNYNVSNGLPSSEVYAMLQDKQGYMWFATDMGVSRFDGYVFKNFTTNNGLADNTIFNIYQDQKGRIWFTSFSGKLSYYFNGEIHSLSCNQRLTEVLLGTFMSSIYVDEHDTIWAGSTNNIVLRIDPAWTAKNVNVINMPLRQGYLCRFKNDAFIFGGGFADVNTFCIYDRTSTCVETITLFPEDSVPAAIRFSVTLLSKDKYVLTANERVYAVDLNHVSPIGRLPGQGVCAHAEFNGEILIGSYSGLQKWKSPAPDQSERISFFDQKVITAIARDNDNGLWICTEGNGVYCVAFSNFLYYTPQDGLPNSKIGAITVAGTAIVTAHADGTICFLHGTDVWSMHADNNNFLKQFPRFTSLLSVNADTLIASGGNNWFMVDQKQHSVKPFLVRGSRCILKASDGGVWSSGYNCIVKSNASGKNVVVNERFPRFADNLFEDHNGTLWICAIDGLWTWTKTKGFTYYGDVDSTFTSRIVDLQEDNNNALWMSSRGSGVIIRKDGVNYHLTEKDGLAGDMCRGVFVDSCNVVWVGSNQGLSRIEYDFVNGFHYAIKTFTTRNGLYSNEINKIFRHDGKLWTVHTNGISIFDPAELQIPGNAPPVYITSTMMNGGEIDTLRHQFNYDQNYFTFNFIGLSYKDPGNITYRYRMEGVDEQWVETKYTSVNFQTLPPGNYRFLVEAKNTDGNWSSAPATFSFVVTPAWWQTWYVYALGVIIIGSFVVFLFVMRIRVIRRRAESKTQLQNKIATYELNALRAQMNPHFVFNSINSVQYFITNNDPDSSQKYLSKFAKLIRYVVDNSRLSTIALSKELEALGLYLELEALRFGSRLEYAIHVDSEVDVASAQIPSMLIQPYVENAIWHGLMHKEGNGRITINLSLKNESVVCTIEDNGIGRAKSQEFKREKRNAGYKSVGMTNTRERLQIINQVRKSNLTVEVTDLYNDDETPRGTRVIIHIPVS